VEDIRILRSNIASRLVCDILVFLKDYLCMSFLNQFYVSCIDDHKPLWKRTRKIARSYAVQIYPLYTDIPGLLDRSKRETYSVTTQ
jgi:hypothetical protein